MSECQHAEGASHPRGEIRCNLDAQQALKVRVTTLAEKHPEVIVVERLDSGELELKDVALQSSFG